VRARPTSARLSVKRPAAETHGHPPLQEKCLSAPPFPIFFWGGNPKFRIPNFLRVLEQRSYAASAEC
jgi:hypothetical protein